VPRERQLCCTLSLSLSLSPVCLTTPLNRHDARGGLSDLRLEGESRLACINNNTNCERNRFLYGAWGRASPRKGWISGGHTLIVRRKAPKVGANPKRWLCLLFSREKVFRSARPTVWADDQRATARLPDGKPTVGYDSGQPWALAHSTMFQCSLATARSITCASHGHPWARNHAMT